MKNTLIFGVVAAFAVTVAHAEPINDRTEAMDQVRVGAATLVPMIKGDAAFDAQIAELALRMTYAAAIAFNGPLFPEGSESKGANTAIWSNFDDFTAKRGEFVVNAKAAVAAKPTDLAGLKAVYEPMLANCAACHKDYRIKN